MSHDHTQSSLVSKSGVSAILAAFACAGAAWAIGAGSVLAPEPADLKSALVGSTGATAAAVIIQQRTANYLLWPASFQVGNATIVAGAPCSPYGLPYGTRTTSRIVASGAYRACLDYNPFMPPPATMVRPLPPMPVDGSNQNKSAGAIAATAIDIVTVIMWPADWLNANDAGVGTPYAGQPCSDFALYAGESTYKHIQGATCNNEFRCVGNTEPIYRICD